MTGSPASRVLIPLLLAIALGGCEQRSPFDPDAVAGARQIPADILPAVEEVVEATNQFALDLYAQVREEDGNLFLSPYSVAAALSMTYAGAAGVTAEEMAQVLHATGNDRWHEAFGALQSSLDRGAALGGYELSSANRLWGQEDCSFLDSFLDVTGECYGAELGRLDFSHDPEGSRLTINDWVADQTRDKIVDLLGPGDVTALTRLILTNAIYFKGTWLWEFDSELTQDYPFITGPTGTVTVPLMQGEAEFGYAESENLQVLAMPYASGDVSMIVLLPRGQDGLAQLEAQLTYVNLESWLASLEETDVIVGLPRFTVAWKDRLEEALADMGMSSAFRSSADFSGMTGQRDLFVSGVVHQAHAEVNEQGTEAAAATAVVMEWIVSDPDDPGPPRFVADHPFLFLIYDHVTGGILFMGRVVNPLEGGE
jgi:serpin B